MLAFVFVGLGLLAAVLGAPNPYTGHEVGSYRSGTLNDGKWDCPWYLNGFECHDGTFTCTCPGDGATVNFKVGCCYKFPECGVICNKGTTCGRYANCASCRSGIGEWSENVCSRCKPGFALGVGNCRSDINECNSGNGGCAHNCVNTYGSFYCTCRSGFRLMSNKRDCERLSCGHPGDVNAGRTTATASWLFNSYAKFECSSPTLSLVGWSSRKCIGQGARVWWDGAQPQCRDTCSAVKDNERMACGSSGVTRENCIQLGCCYHDLKDSPFPSCYHNPVLTFIKFSGERPTPNNGNGIYTQERSTQEGCAFQCVHDNAGRCKSFAIRQNGFDKEHEMTFQKCHLQEYTRSHYAAHGQLKSDSNYDLYEPLIFQPFSVAYGQAEPMEVLEKLYVGCFKDKDDERDMSHFMFTSGSDMNIAKCQGACRQEGYAFAGLQDGMHCYCSNSLARIHGPSDSCGTACTGDRTEICGGELSNSVYHVPYDHRYVGCYHDDSPHDLPISLWKRVAKRSASACVEECALNGYKYAGVQNGGDCYCGNSYGHHSAANESQCHVKCEGWSHQNCGGQSQNAIYFTEAPFDLSSGFIRPDVRRAYDSSGKLAGISTRLFSFAPHLRSVVTKKLVIYSENEVQTPFDDTACSDNCYSPCGEISQVDQLTNVGDTLILRFFHIRLSDILKYTGNSARKVYVYAQTVLIDSSISVDFALLVRTRQLLLDRSYALSIDVHGNAPDLDINFEEARANGPEPELLHRKMSFTCARILLQTKQARNTYSAWGIIKEIVQNIGSNEESAAYGAHVRAFQGFLYGLERENIHYVPYYTKAHISQVLGNYYERLSLYKTNLNRLEDQSINQNEFLQVAEETQKIYMDTDIAEAQAEYQASQVALTTSNTTYHRYKEHFDYSRRLLEEARGEFEKGLKEAMAWRIVKAIVKVVGAIAKVVAGVVDFDTDDLVKSTSQIVEDATGMVNTMQLLSYGIQEIETLDRMTEQIFYQLEHVNDVHDTVKFADNLEMTISMHTNLVQWSNLRNYGDVMLAENDLEDIPGAKQYKKCLLDTINWGEALTKSMIEKAELLRYSMDCKFILKGKVEQQNRIQGAFDKSREGIVAREEIMRAIHEQTYDVRSDLNDALLMFCQSFFFENHYECKESYKPAFGGSIDDLLMKINAARRDELLIPGSAPSTASRILTITDSNTDPNCTDALECPINHFRINRVFYYKLPIDEADLNDLDRYMVSEIILDFKGAKATDSNTFLKMRIESSGDFQSKYNGRIYNFLTRPLTLAFEYDVSDGHISLRADVYKPFRNIVNHITPYSTWVMRVDEDRSGTIDVSKVTSLSLRLDGSAVDTKYARPMSAIDGENPEELEAVLEGHQSNPEEIQTPSEEQQALPEVIQAPSEEHQELEVISGEQQAIPEESQTVPEESQTVPEENQAVLEENQAISEENQASPVENQAISEENQASPVENQASPEENQAMIDSIVSNTE